MSNALDSLLAGRPLSTPLIVSRSNGVHDTFLAVITVNCYVSGAHE